MQMNIEDMIWMHKEEQECSNTQNPKSSMRKHLL